MLRWIGDAIDKGKISFSKVHEEESESAAFLDWLKTYAPYLPPKLLPEEEDMQVFANYFASYLTTSFDFAESPEYKLMSMSGGRCNCSICLRLVKSSHLKVKKPRKVDKIEAKRKHIDNLVELAQREGVDISETAIEKILEEPLLLQISANLVYANSILDRMKGKATGVYVLVLWRQIAWHASGSPIRDFSLEVHDILEAEKIMIEVIKNYTG